MAQDTYPPVANTVRFSWEWAYAGPPTPKALFTNFYVRDAVEDLDFTYMSAVATAIADVWFDGADEDRSNTPTSIASVAFHCKDLSDPDNPTFTVPYAADGTSVAAVYSTGVCPVIQAVGDAGGRPKRWYQRWPYAAEADINGNELSGARRAELATLINAMGVAISDTFATSARVGVGVLVPEADNPVPPDIYMDAGVTNTLGAPVTVRARLGRSVSRLKP